MENNNPTKFKELLRSTGIKARLVRDLRFTEQDMEKWLGLELASVATRAGNKGVLVIQLADETYLAPYELMRRIANASTGRSKSVTCDFCFTWQHGDRAARIIFQLPDSSVGFICCGDLACSLHVRDITDVSRISRVHLPEQMTSSQRKKRLQAKLWTLTQLLDLNPIESEK